jgi:hypothetical protein
MFKYGKYLLAVLLVCLSPAMSAWAGHWALAPEEVQITGGLSNQRWVEDDGSYAADCIIWLDPEETGRYACYTFDKDGYLWAGTTRYGTKFDAQGRRLTASGQVDQILVPRDTAVIALDNYTVTLPDNWVNHFCYHQSEKGTRSLSVYFFPPARSSYRGRLQNSVFQTMFMILQFKDEAAMEKERREGMVDGWRYLGRAGGKLLVYGQRTDTAAGLFNEEQKTQIEAMQDTLDPAKLIGGLE